jgi:hypothetical protein
MMATMTAVDPSRPAGASRARRWALVLAFASVWAAVVPYLGRAIGWRLDVAASVEVVDHVVPGGVALAAASVLAGVGSRVPVAVGDVRWSVAAGASFLAGFWIAATHAPLVAEALDGVSPWDAALLHLSAGLPVLATGAALLVLPLAGRR